MTSPLSPMAALTAVTPTRCAGDDAVAPPASGAGSGGAGEFALALQRHSGGLGAEAGATLGRQRAAAASRAAAERPAEPSADESLRGESRWHRALPRSSGAGDAQRLADAEPPAASAIAGAADLAGGLLVTPGAGDDAPATPADALPADAALPAPSTWPTWLPLMPASVAAIAGHGDAAAAGIEVAAAVAGSTGARDGAPLADAAAAGGGAGPGAGRNAIDALAVRPLQGDGPFGGLAAMRLAAADGGADRAVTLPTDRETPSDAVPRGAADDAGIGRAGQDLAAGRNPGLPGATDGVADASSRGRQRGGDAAAASMVDGEAVRAVAKTDAGRREALGAARSGEVLAPASSREPIAAPAAPSPTDTRFEPDTHRALAATAEARERTPAAAPEPVAAAPVDSTSAAAPPAASFALAMPASAALAATTTAAAATPLQARIDVAIDQPGFAPALGVHLSLMARDGVQQARLQLHPAEMGPIDVQIAIDGSAARIDFHAAVAATREAIEASLPTLAGALRESGLTLAGGGVFQQAAGQQSQDPGASGRRGSGSTRDPVDADRRSVGAAGRSLQRRGLVDLVA